MKPNIKRILSIFLSLSCGLIPLGACSGNYPGTGPTIPDTAPDNQAPQNPIAGLSAISTAPNRATTVLLANAPTGADGVTMGTLQGLAAKQSSTQILLRANAWSLYLTNIQSAGTIVRETDALGKAWNLASLLAYYAPQLSGYILSSQASLSVAISISGVTNAVVVQKENEQLAIDAGLTLLLDVSDKDDAWLRQSEYFGLLSRSVAVEQPASMAPKLIDYAVMAGAYINFYQGTQSGEHTVMFDFLDDNAVILGWNNVLGEYATVRSFADVNACLIPADHAYNLSTLSSFAGDGKLNETLYATEESNKSHVNNTSVHTVCIVMSDGDNLQWALNDYATNPSWYASPLRGKFAMTWGLPPLLGDLALPMMQHYGAEQSATDEFIMQLSGLGYTFPSRWSAEAKASMASRLSSVMRARGMRYMSILDDHGFTAENMNAFTSQDGIEGVFYIDYDNYAGYQGAMLWSNSVPVVSARYRLWSGLDGCDPQSIASSINQAPVGITNQDAYSFIIVHAWSGLDKEGNLVASGDTMAAVDQLVSLLGDQVEVVTASEFMNRIKDNVKPQ